MLSITFSPKSLIKFFTSTISLWFLFMISLSLTFFIVSRRFPYFVELYVFSCSSRVPKNSLLNFLSAKLLNFLHLFEFATILFWWWLVSLILHFFLEFCIAVFTSEVLVTSLNLTSCLKVDFFLLLLLMFGSFCNTVWVYLLHNPCSLYARIIKLVFLIWFLNWQSWLLETSLLSFRRWKTCFFPTAQVCAFFLAQVPWLDFLRKILIYWVCFLLSWGV